MDDRDDGQPCFEWHQRAALVPMSTSSPNIPRWRAVFRPLNLALTLAFGCFVTAVFHFGRSWSWSSAVVAGLVGIGLSLTQDLIKGAGCAGACGWLTRRSGPPALLRWPPAARWSVMRTRPE